MALFKKKNEEEEPERVRKPVEKIDRSAYVQTISKSAKTSSKTKSKGDGKKMAEKKIAPKDDAKKETVKKTAVKKEAEPKKETAKKPAAEKKTVAKKETVAKTDAKPAAEKKEAVKKPAAAKEKPKVWHITKREDVDKWQVKAEGNEKATKLFRTKAEAEEFVKKMSANNEGSRVVAHKKDGKFQKK